MNLAQFTTAASDYAAHVDALFALLSVISGAVVALVAGLIIFFLIRYHRGSRAPRGETPERLDREIEIGWTVATFFTFLFLFWWAASDQLSALVQPRIRWKSMSSPSNGCGEFNIRAGLGKSTSCTFRHIPMFGW